MSSFKDFLRWYNNTDVVPTLAALQKMIAFYHDKGIHMLKLGCTLPNLANICLHQSTNANSIPSQKEIRNYWKNFEKISMVDHLLFLQAKQLLTKLFSESPQTFANLLLRLMPTNSTCTRCVNPCPPVFIRVGISIQKPVDSHLGKTRPVALKIWSCLVFNVQDLIVKFRASTLQADRRKKNCFSVDGFCSHCNTVFEAMGCFYHFCPCQELLSSLTEEDIKHGSRKKENDELRRSYMQEKSFTVIEIRECE